VPSSRELRDLRRAQSNVLTLALADLANAWAGLDLTDPETAQAVLLRLTPALSDTYGSLSAAVAADWYDDLRRDREIAGTFRAAPAEPVAAGRVEGTTQRITQHLWTDTPEAALTALSGRLGKYVMQPGRDTVVAAVQADPSQPRWARVPSSPKPCEFCEMLAGRGAVYLSEDTADGTEYHDHCGCAAVPVWDGESI
jgi:hypothetical protein